MDDVVTLKEAWRVVAEWHQRYLYTDPVLLELARAIEYGGVEIKIVAGKITEITPYRGVKERDKVTTN